MYLIHVIVEPLPGFRVCSVLLTMGCRFLFVQLLEYVTPSGLGFRSPGIFSYYFWEDSLGRA